MNTTVALKNKRENSFTMHPKRFAMWLFMASVTILFAAFTSAYIVQRSNGEWLDIALPSLFDYTSALIVLSSVSMHGSILAAKRNQIKTIRWALAITFVLGLAFLAGQFLAWGQLVDANVHLVGNPSGSFIYVLTGVHGAHLISAVIFLAVVITSAFRYKIHSKSLVQLEICATYWHFLGGIWLYLYLFLALYH